MNLLDLIFPKSCLECGKGNKYICETCLAKVPVCGWHKNQNYSIWEYKGVIRKAILALKYKHSTEIAEELGAEALKRLRIENFESKNVVLIPIPIHWHKENLRGFNQSELLGKIASKGMRWNFLGDFLIKKKATKSQVELKGSERRNNLKGVFAINSKFRDLGLKDKTIVILDDVYTTGSSLKEAFTLLMTLKPKKLIGLTISK